MNWDTNEGMLLEQIKDLQNDNKKLKEQNNILIKLISELKDTFKDLGYNKTSSNIDDFLSTLNR